MKRIRGMALLILVLSSIQSASAGILFLAGTVKDGEAVHLTVSAGKLAINGREVAARAA